MNETIDKKPRGLSITNLRLWGVLFLLVGAAGMSILEHSLLGLDQLTGSQLLEAMGQSKDVMAMATVALICRAINACAAPIFAFLLVEGVTHTKNFWLYFLRVAGIACLSEIPYNLAVTGKVLAMGSRNPVFGLVIAMVVLFFYRYYAGKSVGKIAIKVAVTLAALLWASMLGVTDGACMVVLVAVLWVLRNMQAARAIFGCTAAFACTLFSPYYIASPMAFLAIHFYNGEKGEESRVFNYLCYPMILLACWLMGNMLQ